VKDKGYFQSRFNSILIALGGIREVLISQQNARIHLLASLIVILAGLLLKISRHDWIDLVLVIGLVWMAEIFNTAVEYLVNRVNPEHSEQAKLIKDISAGAVLLSAFTSVLVGILIFGPRLLELIK
jgi:diacylglycerol kinase